MGRRERGNPSVSPKERGAGDTGPARWHRRYRLVENNCLVFRDARIAFGGRWQCHFSQRRGAWQAGCNVRGQRKDRAGRRRKGLGRCATTGNLLGKAGGSRQHQNVSALTGAPRRGGTWPWVPKWLGQELQQTSLLASTGRGPIREEGGPRSHTLVSREGRQLKEPSEKQGGNY